MSRKELDFKTRLIIQLLILLGVLLVFGGTLIFLGRDMRNTAEEINSKKTEYLYRQLFLLRERKSSKNGNAAKSF